MNKIGVIVRKEAATYLTSPVAYITTAVFLVLSGTFFATYLAGTDYSDTSVQGFLGAAKMLILLFAALLTMRLVAEERKLGTWEILTTAPVGDAGIVLGKFLASLLILTAMLALTLYYPLLLMIFGNPDLGPIGTSYLGLFLLGSACLSVGIFASSLTSNQIVSAVVAGGILYALWFVGAAASLVSGAPAGILASISLSHYFPDFERGVVDTRAVIYYVSVTATFLYLTIWSVEAGRWR